MKQLALLTARPLAFKINTVKETSSGQGED